MELVYLSEDEQFLLDSEMLMGLELEDVENDENENPFSTDQTKCILGLYDSLKWFVLRAIGASLLQFIILVLFGSNALVRDLLNGAIGICLLCATVDRPMLMAPLIVYALFSAILILEKRNFLFLIGRKDFVCSFFTIAYILACQFLYDPSDFMSVRGALMIAAMKQISLAFDIDEWPSSASNSRKDHSPTERVSMMAKLSPPPPNDAMSTKCSIFAFVFNPATILFGPPLTFEEFSRAQRPENRQLLLQKSALLRRWLASLRCLAISLLFLVLSSCVLDPEVGPFFHLSSSSFHSFFVFFLHAASFRFSHYFVCHFAGACALFGGFCDENLDEISHWQSVEWPQSMAEVVVRWNRPMHTFLHKYVYRRANAKFVGNHLAPILLTFGVSASLHGFDIQMMAVLLSLGFCAFAETRFRERLSSCLSACIRARNCTEQCGHKFKRDHPAVIGLRLLFTLINIFHLAYLGAPFHGDGQFTGYTLAHLWGIWWGEFRCSSHILALSALFCSILLPKKRNGEEEERRTMALKMKKAD